MDLSPQSGLVGYWKFDQGGQVVVDSSGSGNDGSLGENNSLDNDDPNRIISDVPVIGGCGEVLIPFPHPTPDPSTIIVDEFHSGITPGTWVIQEPSTSVFPFEVTPDKLTITGGDDNQHLRRLNTSIDISRPYAMQTTFKINTIGGVQSYAMHFLQDDQAPSELINSWALNVDLTNGASNGLVKHMGFQDGVFQATGQHNAGWAQPFTSYIFRVDVNTRLNGSFSPNWVTGKIMTLYGDVLDLFEIDYTNFPWQPTQGQFASIGLNVHGSNTETKNLIVWYTDGLPAGNRPPLASAGTDQTVIDTNEDGFETVTFDGSLSNDPDGDSLTYTWNEDTTLLGTGQSINADLNLGEHTITLTVNDGQGHEASDSVIITVNAVGNNIPPVAQDDMAGPILEGSFITIDVLANDLDDGTLVPGSVLEVTPPSHGSTSIDLVTGQITYTDDGTSTADDSFTYTVEDNLGGVSNEATVTVSIIQTNDNCGRSLSLDGNDDWINVPNLVLSGDFTIEAWVKLAPGIDNKDAIVGQEGTGPDINFFGGQARLYTASTPIDAITASTSIQADTWVHVAITRSGSNLSFYLNGLLDAMGTWAENFPIQALGRGNLSTSIGGYLEGELDEVRIWTVARSGGEISANYNQSVSVGSTGLAAYWTFNESGQAVVDESGSGNDGSLGIGAGVGSDDPVRTVSTAPITENCNGGGNQTPVAVDDSAGPIDPSASVAIDVLANDLDDGALVPGSVLEVTPPSHGSTSVDLVTGQITYTDDGTLTADDTFTYTVEDDQGVVSNAATVTVSINTSGNQTPVAVDDSAGPVDPSGSVSINVLANDLDDGTLVPGSVLEVTPPSHGSTSVDLVTGQITYTDDGTSTADDSFTYTVEDDQGVLSNAATVTVSITQANGSCGMGLSLDGSDDWVNVPNLVLSGDFTVEAWVKLAPGISGVDALLGQEGAGTDINFFGGQARLFSSVGPVDVITTTTTIQANTWVHVAITRSGTDLTLYLNGTSNVTGTWTGSLPIQALGRGNQSVLGHLEGELDEVRIWTVARSGGEISANYNQSVSVGSTGLAAYWTFNESGQAVVDESGSGNDGSLGIGAGVGSDDPVRIVSTAPITENCNF